MVAFSSFRRAVTTQRRIKASGKRLRRFHWTCDHQSLGDCTPHAAGRDGGILWILAGSPPRRGVSQLSCGQTITVRNFPLLGSGPILSRMWAKKSDTAAVSVGRVPSGACFGEPVEEFDPRPVRNNIGDAQPWFVL